MRIKGEAPLSCGELHKMDGSYREVNSCRDNDEVRPLHFPEISLQPAQLFN